jgi:hypothetical protein
LRHVTVDTVEDSMRIRAREFLGERLAREYDVCVGRVK